jgi:hypothetical protein
VSYENYICAVRLVFGCYFERYVSYLLHIAGRFFLLSFCTDILALTSQYCKLESKFCEEKLARLRLNDDTERLKERLDVLEALVRKKGDNSGLGSNNKQGFVEDPDKRDSGNVK